MELLILQVIRGEKHWRELESIGISVKFIEDSLHIEDRTKITVKPAIKDVALGFLRHRFSNELSTWATVILGLTAINFSEIEQDSVGEKILDALWEASTNNHIDSDIMEIIEDIALKVD